MYLLPTKKPSEQSNITRKAFSPFLLAIPILTQSTPILKIRKKNNQEQKKIDPDKVFSPERMRVIF